MIDNSFTMGRVKIIGEPKIEMEEEIRAQLRRKMFDRLRLVIPLFILATILAFAYCCRAELQFLFFSKPATQTGRRSSTVLQTARNNNAARDSGANKITK